MVAWLNDIHLIPIFNKAILKVITVARLKDQSILSTHRTDIKPMTLEAWGHIHQQGQSIKKAPCSGHIPHQHFQCGAIKQETKQQTQNSTDLLEILTWSVSEFFGQIWSYLGIYCIYLNTSWVPLPVLLPHPQHEGKNPLSYICIERNPTKYIV